MALVSKNFSDIITFTRASTATYFDSAGVLQSAAIDTPRFDYDPATLAARGLLIEEARTNSIRNNTMQGAVAGTPGTLPTNWSASTSAVGVTREVVGTGTEDGIAYFDIRYYGTPTSGTSAVINFEVPNQIVASSGQTWAQTTFVKLQAGSFAGTNTTLSLLATDGSAGVQSFDTSAITSTPSNLSECRLAIIGAFTNASTTHAQPRVRIGYTVGVPFDITLRIGLPQLELGAFATSVIPTTTTALTRSADVAAVNTLSPWYNSASGTLYAEYIRFTNAASGRIATFSDGTASNQIRINASVSTNIRPDWQVLTGGAVQANVTGAAEVVVNAIGKTAGRYAANDFQQATNGALGSADISGTVPSVTTLHLGGNEVAGNLNGWLRRLTFYPRGQSNAELQALTA